MSKTRRFAKVAVCTLALLAASSWFPARLSATNYLIATTADDAIDNGNCTLREALRASNLDVAIDLCPAGGSIDAITLLDGTYPFNGGEVLGEGGKLSLQGQSHNPFLVKIALGSSGKFLRLFGGGEYTLGGFEIADGEDANTGGGAIHAANVGLTIDEFRMVGNSSTLVGGALSFGSSDPGQSLVLRRGTFLTNSATGGGAVHATVDSGADIDIRDVTFIGNSAIEADGSALAGALRVSASGAGSIASCVRCIFQNNLAQGTEPGEGYAFGGALVISVFESAHGEIIDSRFTGNSAESADEIMSKTAVIRAQATDGASLLLARLFVDANAGTTALHNTDVTLTAYGSGTTLSFLDSQLTFGVGDGLSAYADSAAIQLGHLTIADYPGVGAEVRTLATGTLSLENSIVASNGTDLTIDGTLSQVTSSVGGSMLFVNQLIGDYHLTGASPAVNTGTNGAATVRLADLDFRGRIAGSATDRGCYEFNSIFAHSFDIADYGGWSNFVP